MQSAAGRPTASSALPIIRALPRVCDLAEPRLVPPLADELHPHGQLQVRVFWSDPVFLCGGESADGERQCRVAGPVERAAVQALPDGFLHLLQGGGVGGGMGVRDLIRISLRE